MKHSERKQPSAKADQGVSLEFLYEQVADQLRREIRTGKLKPGSRIPSLDDLAASHKVNRLTVNRALSQLKAEGLAVSIPARGTYVPDELPPEGSRRKN